LIKLATNWLPVASGAGAGGVSSTTGGGGGSAGDIGACRGAQATTPKNTNSQTNRQENGYNINFR
jgi:hypothetical protein